MNKKDLISVIICVAIFGLTYGLSAPLIATRLQDNGFSESYIGLNAAMQAIGVFAVAPFIPRLFQRFHPRLLLGTSLAAVAVIMLLFTCLPFIYWFGLRLALGIFSEIIMVLTETWINDATVEQARARTMAWYTAGISTGFACGPLILTLSASQSNFPFFIGTAIVLLALVLVKLLGMAQHHSSTSHAIGFLKSIRIAFLMIVATGLNAAVEVAGLNFLPLYAESHGWSRQHAVGLISVLMLGAILLQPVVGMIADSVDRRRLIVILALLSTVGAAIWPWLLSWPVAAYLILFVWGGMFVGIYTVAITWAGATFSGAELAGVYAAASVAWGAGALLGPLLCGLAMSATQNGLPLMVGVLCGLFCLMAAVDLRIHGPGRA
ncbi:MULTISPECIES: MFS transporter [Pantoea]|uniref:MFS transporter n=1 Tax=Pantoea TaxID=53335 RepID=UPI000CF4211E|nr:MULTISPECIES: MFS transporter [Pantoea]MCS3404543.1 MFS transporter [Pantoea sp. B566]MDI6539652.1 MFS transporter [Pantoea ananatis]NCU10244.1 MFS transporter [Pantoea ananatis]PQK94221.1 MFS transporter [Pantoea ananatis]PQK98427.1 MFS transporter [Pantoea ananatis]